MIRRHAKRQVAEQHVATDTTQFAIIYRPMWAGFLCTELTRVAAELACPQSMRDSIREALDGKEGVRAVKARFTELLEAYPAGLKDQILASLSGPFDRAQANSLRTDFEKQGKEASEQWAAIVALAQRAGVASLNGTQLKSFARAAWFKPGIVDSPVGLHLKCPSCAGQANASVAIPMPGYHDEATDWHLRCTHCGFEDFHSDPPSFGYDDAILEEADIRVWVCKSPAVSGRLPASKARRDAALRVLNGYCKNLRNLVNVEVETAVGELRDRWPREHSFRAWRALQFNAHAYENLLLGIQLMFHTQYSGRYSWQLTDADGLLEQVPKSDMSLATVKPDHPAPHWRIEFDARQAKLENAVAAGDAVEGAIQAVLFVESCRKNGLATSLLLNVNLPSELRPAPSIPPKAVKTDRLHDVSITELSEFLAQVLSTPFSVVDPKGIAGQLQRFAAGQTKGPKT